MRLFLLSLLTCAASFSSHAQEPVPHVVPKAAVAKLEKVRRNTLNAVVIGQHTADLPPESRPMLNRLLVQSAVDFLAITTRNPTKDAYLRSLDLGLTRIVPLVPKAQDREQVAEYFQDLLDIVGLDSSEGRLTAFVEGGQRKP